jgi:hypothetical protein
MFKYIAFPKCILDVVRGRARLLARSLRGKITPWPESASELYRPSDHRLSAKLVLTSCR